MNDVLSRLTSFLPSKRKNTPSGWISFNAPCCHNRGQSLDKRQRGGILLKDDEGFQYHCFNCGFTAGWTPGHLLSKNTKDLFKWMGMSQNEINELGLVSLKYKNNQPNTKPVVSLELDEMKLPEFSLPLEDWISQKVSGSIENNLLAVVEYLVKRGLDINWYPWHWCPGPGYQDRLLVPFYNKGKIVGYSGRKITEGRPKYLTHSSPGYVFNIDKQTEDRSFVLLVEGQLDAIAIDGCAIMTNEPNETQIFRIKQLGKPVIVVPDRDKAGSKIINAAIEHDWAVSFPKWNSDIKDVADAVKSYGRLYTLLSILKYKETNKTKIKLFQKHLEQL